MRIFGVAIPLAVILVLVYMLGARYPFGAKAIGVA